MATPSGERAIGSLKPGDTVLAYDAATGKPQAEPVQYTWVNHDRDLVDVRLQVAPDAAAQSRGAAQGARNATAMGPAQSGAGRVAQAAMAVTAALAAVGLLAPATAVSAPADAGATAHTETIHTTANHPWLTADRGWVQAGDLRAGEAVVTLDGGTAGTVAWGHTVAGQADMYNLTVAGRRRARYRLNSAFRIAFTTGAA